MPRREKRNGGTSAKGAVQIMEAPRVRTNRTDANVHTEGGFLLMTRGVTFINHSLDRQWKLKAGACSVLVHLLNKETWSLYTLSGPKLCSEHPEIRLPGSREK